MPAARTSATHSPFAHLPAAAPRLSKASRRAASSAPVAGGPDVEGGGGRALAGGGVSGCASASGEISSVVYSPLNSCGNALRSASDSAHFASITSGIRVQNAVGLPSLLVWR